MRRTVEGPQVLASTSTSSPPPRAWRSSPSSPARGNDARTRNDARRLTRTAAPRRARRVALTIPWRSPRIAPAAPPPRPPPPRPAPPAPPPRCGRERVSGGEPAARGASLASIAPNRPSARDGSTSLPQRPASSAAARETDRWTGGRVPRARDDAMLAAVTVVVAVGSAHLGRASCTCTAWPARSRLRTMRAPICPSPTKPTAAPGGAVAVVVVAAAAAAVEAARAPAAHAPPPQRAASVVSRMLICPLLRLLRLLARSRGRAG
eukprot:scaffold7215_cov366-Prasinococcus_capsulatus_cf.AAC.22